MPRPIPFPTKQKSNPAGKTDIPDTPAESVIEEQNLNTTPIEEETPKTEPIKEEIPEETPPNNTEMAETQLKEEMPSVYNEENCVVIDGQKIEIKPTKVAYFRNRTAATYNAMKNIPLTELFSVKKGVLDDSRDGDQIVFDFLVAALDDSDFVRDKYNDFNADQIERIVQIFGRINHIDEKYETQRKNREAQGNR